MWFGRDSEPFHGETLDSFRFGANLLADAVSSLRVLSRSLRPSDVPWRLRANKASVNTPEQAAVFLARITTESLRAVAPRVVVQSRSQTEENKPQHADVTVVAGSHAAQEPQSLFTVCVAQLFNHLTENARYRHCQNDLCGRLFVRHEGRARHGQHHLIGTKYCTAQCAAAQRQRERRKRQQTPTTKASPDEAD